MDVQIVNSDAPRAGLLRSLCEAVLALFAMLGTLACSQAVAPGAASGGLGVVLALSLARSHVARAPGGARDALLALPLVSLASVGVGALLHAAPWLGAAVFVAGMAGSIWIRRFGARALRAGSLIALPLVTILVVPHLPRRDAGPLPASLVPVTVAFIALVWVMVAQKIGQRAGWLQPADRVPDIDAPAQAAASTLRPAPPTRMALQMAVALAASFTVGYLAFPSHWRWIVLTAFIVNSGNRGRQDVAHKSVLRVLGAAGGTVVALLLASQAALGPSWVVAAILASVFLGVWLRPAGYGWWALFVTLALALLQSMQPTAAPWLLWQRLAGILVGAAIGVAAAWFVYPIRSTDVLRRRIADALAAMSAALDPQSVDRRREPVVLAMRRVQQLRPSFDARRLALRRWQALQPADWIDALLACQAPLLDLVDRRETPGAVRKALGTARKAMREPAEIGPALDALRLSLRLTSDGA
jgi:hypothetical protein